MKTLVFLLALSLSESTIARPIDMEHYFVSDRILVDKLLQEASEKSTGPHSNVDLASVTKCLLAAAELEPYRVDLFFSAAASLIFARNVDDALNLYYKILEISPEEMDAHSYIAVWNRFKGNQTAVDQHLEILGTLHPSRQKELKEIFALIDGVSAKTLSDKLPTDVLVHSSGPQAIIALGFMLNPDGTMKQELIQRLERTLILSKELPDAFIIVTGGLLRNNQTEAKLMAEWLIENGVDRTRIFQENYSRTTLENALYVRYVLAKHCIKRAFIITSAAHACRAETIFTIVSWQTGPRDIQYVSIATEDLSIADDREKMNIYRDALRALGLRSYRSYPLEYL